MTRRCTAKTKKTGKQCNYKALPGKRKCGHHAQAKGKASVNMMSEESTGPRQRGNGPAEWTEVEKRGKADKRFEYGTPLLTKGRSLPSNLQFYDIGKISRSIKCQIKWDPIKFKAQQREEIAKNWE